MTSKTPAGSSDRDPNEELADLKRMEKLLLEAFSAVTALNELASADAVDFEDRMTLLLGIGCQHFQVHNALLLERRGVDFIVRQSLAREPEFQAGEWLEGTEPLLEKTWSADGVHCEEDAIGRTGVFSSVGPWIGIRLRSHGPGVGILAFFDPPDTKHHFAELDRDVVSLIALWTAGELARDAVELERRGLLEAVRKERATLHELIKGAPVAICMLDRDFRYVAWSARWAQDYGLTGEELEGRRHYELFPDLPDYWKKLHARALEGEYLSSDEDEFLGTAGRQYIRWAIQPWFQEGDIPGGIIILTEDVTNYVEAREEAIAASRTKSSFLAAMSHEIRTPMNGVLGMVQLLKKTELSVKQQRFVECIQGSAESLLVILNDILDYSRIEAGKLDLQSIEFNLRLMIDDVLALYLPRAEKRGLRLSLDMSDALPVRVIGDPGRFRQILTNLVDNALKFTEEGEVRILVETRDETRESATFVVHVSDTGPGISPEERKRLFGVFSQGEAGSKSRYGGSGLGLSICKQLVELAGGELGVESAPGKGSSFWFRIPFEKQDVQTTHHLNKVTRPPKPEKMTPDLKLRILLAEDNPINREVAEAFLQGMGCDVHSVEDGRDVAKLVEQGGFDLVLMDCQMPEVDGFEATRQVRRLPPPACETPIIAMTASAMSSERDHCFTVGMSDFLAKPVKESELYDLLSKFGKEPVSKKGFRITEKTAKESHPVVDILDRERLDAVTGKNRDFRISLLKLSKIELSDRVDELKKAYSSGEFERVAQLAHRIKGGAENIGAFGLGALCRELKPAAESGNAGKTAKLVSELSAMTSELCEEIDRLQELES